MFLYRLMVPIFILSYFGGIKCVKFEISEYISEPTDLEKAYLNEVVGKKLNEEISHSICTKSITDEDKIQVLTACTATFIKFRKLYRRYNKSFYVYYNYYETLNSLCKTGTVELYRYRNGKTYEQALIPCYITLPIVETSFLNPGITDIDTSSKSEIFDRYLIIPTNRKFSSWLVFEYMQSENKYGLLKWYVTKNIKSLYVPASILIFPRPMLTRDMSEIYALLYPFILNWDKLSTSESHVLHQIISARLKYLCLKITEAKMRSTEDIPKPSSSYHPLIFTSPKAYGYDRVLLRTEGYSCDEYVVEPGWFLFTAPGDDAIILGQLSHEEHGEKFYSIKAYVKNVNYKFYRYIL